MATITQPGQPAMSIVVLSIAVSQLSRNFTAAGSKRVESDAHFCAVPGSQSQRRVIRANDAELYSSVYVFVREASTKEATKKSAAYWLSL